MDKHLLSNVASSGLNMAMNVILYIYMNKRIDSIDKKLTDILNHIQNIPSTQCQQLMSSPPLHNQYYQGQPSQHNQQSIPDNVLQTKNFAHTISNVAERMFSGGSGKVQHLEIEQKINNPSLVAISEIDKELEDLKEEENDSDQ